MTVTDLLVTFTVALLAAAVAFATTPVAGRVAAILGMQDVPSNRKLHSALIPPTKASIAMAV